MKQTRITKRRITWRRDLDPVDLRTPSGRALPF